MEKYTDKLTNKNDIIRVLNIMKDAMDVLAEAVNRLMGDAKYCEELEVSSELALQMELLCRGRTISASSKTLGTPYGKSGPVFEKSVQFPDERRMVIMVWAPGSWAQCLTYAILYKDNVELARIHKNHFIGEYSITHDDTEYTVCVTST